MKIFNSIIILGILLINANLLYSAHKITILVTDSASKPIETACIEIETFYGSSLYFGKTDKAGIFNIIVSTVKYDISISHNDYKQLKTNICITDTNEIYHYTLEKCKNFCILEGQMKFKSKVDSVHLFYEGGEGGDLPSVTLNDGAPIICQFDATGHYSAKIPPGSYKVQFYFPYAEYSEKNRMEINFLEGKSYTQNIDFVLHGYVCILELDGYRYRPIIYNSVLEGLQYVPGIFIGK